MNRRYRQPAPRRGIAGPLLLCIVLLIGLQSLLAGLADFLGMEPVPDSPYQGQIELALDALRRAGDAPRTGEGTVALVTGEQFPAEQLFALPIGGIDERGFIVYSAHGVRELTASAPGLDRRHHIVNSYLEGYAPFRADNVFVPLKVLALRKRYQYDHLQYWGRPEIWQTSREAFRFTRGDCEDHAIALADWLIEMGEDARVVLGTHDGTGHAWVVLLRDGQEYLLEATQKSGVSALRRYPLARMMPGYRAALMFNREDFWTNNGRSHLIGYGDKLWTRTSRFRPASS